ncbi:2,3-bisphosphoglycerate-dependent phosphoglycerate mutase [Enterococcus florum]|uniref:2,3-bisphosphoglycerate-dependent phosphoglycerate mutase n=1 Tax=Enterococcus florum TaxID=2480627 RepID=A0A4V0WPN8_9ENTE|nr:2,3-diphosphoglycerate-dependent phosphoglycerate mutase [Enterococcus florum]GCF94509.1 2,3-bisphosphoglycerate-dependent phosphoglycerate mutase [Enterococcus florum]
MTLILIRHGESEANFANYWTGWLDVDLTSKGIEQAQEAGKKLTDAGIVIDAAFESVLKRSIKTAQIVLEQNRCLFVPEIKSWRLNERHYGALIGENKDQMAAKFGEAQVQKWRRNFEEIPPLIKENIDDRRYKALDPRLIPQSESLRMTSERVLPLWQDRIWPLLKEGKTVLVCGHGNSLRVLIQYLESIPKDEVDSIMVPNAAPLLYQFDSFGQISNKKIL